MSLCFIRHKFFSSCCSWQKTPEMMRICHFSHFIVILRNIKVVWVIAGLTSSVVSDLKQIAFWSSGQTNSYTKWSLNLVKMFHTAETIFIHYLWHHTAVGNKGVLTVNRKCKSWDCAWNMSSLAVLLFFSFQAVFPLWAGPASMSRKWMKVPFQNREDTAVSSN